MKKAIIYVFSGTGNTKRVCTLYKQEFAKHDVETTIFEVKVGFENIPNPNEFDLVVFAYPIHAFNAPKIMLELAKALPRADVKNDKQKCEGSGNINGKKKNEKKDFFILKSSGEPLKINNMSSSKFKGILSRKGYRLFSEYHYVMPYNMIFRHTDEMAVKMLNALEGLAPIEAREVLDGKEHKLSTVPFAPILAFIMRIEHPAMKVNGKFFKVDKDKCINCGMCARNCPVQNIKIEDGKFKFGGDCLMCTRCSFNCPTDAFSIGMLNGWRVNGAYSYKMPAEKEENKHEWYCKKAYKRYFENADKKICGNHGEDVV